MTALRMAASALLVTGCLLATASPAQAAGTGWSDQWDGVGRVTVTSNRYEIKLCNLSQDNQEVTVRYSTNNPFTKAIETLKAPPGACTSEEPWLSKIRVFKLCNRASCKAPVWVNRSWL